MVPMGRAGRYVTTAIAALVVGGCGAAAPAGGPGVGSGVGSDVGSGTAGGAATRPTQQRFGAGGDSSVSPSSGPTFPLRLRRTGGIAGYDDLIVLEADGRVRVDTRSVHGRVCTLTVPQQRQLLTLLATLRLGPAVEPPGEGAPPAGPELTESEPITISVTDDRALELDLSDPSLGEVAGLVGSLVSDVTLSVPATTTCTTPPAPVAAPAS